MSLRKSNTSPASGCFANPNADYPVSQGVYKDRFGNRNDLPAAYAAFSPPFHYDAEEGLYVGGQFWDEKVRSSNYAGLFREVYGTAAFDDPNIAYDMIADAIAEYEKSSELNQFNSKYDLYLTGKTALTEQERRGLELFEDEDKAKCAECHPSEPGEDGSPPLFTDFTYDNLGVPQNPENPFYYLPGLAANSTSLPRTASSKSHPCETSQKRHLISIMAFSRIFAR